MDKKHCPCFTDEELEDLAAALESYREWNDDLPQREWAKLYELQQKVESLYE